jgi:hypothetical protein
VNRDSICTYLSGIDARPVCCNGQNIVVELPHVFGKLPEASIAVVEGTIQDGLVEPLQPGYGLDGAGGSAGALGALAVGYEGCGGRMAQAGDGGGSHGEGGTLRWRTRSWCCIEILADCTVVVGSANAAAVVFVSIFDNLSLLGG